MGSAVKLKMAVAAHVFPPVHVLTMVVAPSLDIAREETTSKYDTARHMRRVIANNQAVLHTFRCNS